MKRILGVIVAVALSACGKVVPFEDSMPSQDAVKLFQPGDSSVRAIGTAQSALEGENAELARLTVGATVLVNGVTLITLGALASVINTEPTSVDGNVAVFGPHTPALSLITWRLTVTRTGPNAFDYILEGKGKFSDDSEYRTALSGNHVVAYDEDGEPRRGFGHGSFLVTWNTAADDGGIQFSYARESPLAPASIEVTLDNQREGDEAWDAHYLYTDTPGEGGTFEFAMDANIHGWDPDLTANERWSIKSRWQEDGEGRSDVRLNGGNLTREHTATECWNEVFNSVYRFHSYDDIGWGTEDACAFATADYSEL